MKVGIKMTKYSASDYFMIRTPLLSLADYFDIFSKVDDLDDSLINLFTEPLLKETLLIASSDLSYALEKNNYDKLSKSSEQLMSSLVKYFIRLSTRPTPFGLFSGISVGRFGELTNITVSNTSKHAKRARPDMEWLYGAIKNIEANESIRRNLRIRFNDFTFANGNRLEKPNKSLLQHGAANDNAHESTSIRYTIQVKNIENKSRLFCAYSSIVDELASENIGIPYEKIDTFLSQLLENEYLLSELRPPLINVDVLDYVINILSHVDGVVEATDYISKLSKIKDAISKYNSSKVGEGAELYAEATDLMKELYECKNYLQVDMKTHMENSVLDVKLKSELERFVSVMHEIAPRSVISDEMSHYKSLFLEKYGYGVEIPIMELLDIDRGLGSPAYYTTGVINRGTPKQQKSSSEHRLSTLMNRKIINALREGKNLIEITDNDISFVRGTEKNEINHPMDALQSFEIYLLTHVNDFEKGIEAGYYFTVAPAVASSGIGKTFGRFNDLLTEEETSLLKADFEKQKELLPDYIIAEITELPSIGRISNVSINESGYDYQVALATNPNSDKHVLSIRDLYIGIDHESNFFYIKSKSLNKKVIVTMTSMLNPAFGSNELRFLREISSMRKVNPISGIMSILNSDFEYTPRITYGRVIIKPETWTISKNILGFDGNDKTDFDSKLLDYKKKHQIPRYVFMNEGDNRLLLDLDNSTHRAEIYFNLKKKMSYGNTLTEVGCGFNDYTAINLDKEKYITEIVVPFTLNANEATLIKTNDKKEDTIKTISNISRNRISMNRDGLMILPGKDDWLFFKLYGCSKRQNELLVLIYDKLEEFAPSLEKFFYIRYSDPEPHIRLRFHFKNDELSELLPSICIWFESLRTDGLISTVVIDSYIREAERYGGPDLIKFAEDYFFHDSRLAMQIVKKLRYEKLEIDFDIIGVSFIISALDAFNLSSNEKENFLKSMTSKGFYRKQFQDNKKLLMKAVNNSNNWHDMDFPESYLSIYPLIIETSKKMKNFADVVYVHDKKDMLTNSIQSIISSVIHMFCNRLVGDNSWERKVYALTGHAFHALQGFIKHRQQLP